MQITSLDTDIESINRCVPERRPVRLIKNWIDNIRQDLKEVVVPWKKVQERCADREDWRRHGMNQGTRMNLFIEIEKQGLPRRSPYGTQPYFATCYNQIQNHFSC